MINCVIIEDQPPAQRVLQKYIAEMGNLDLAAVFSDALQAMEFLKSHSIDLVFLDIHLPKISGIDFIKVLEKKPHIILTTAFSDYALESYEYNVVDYLLKPYSFERFVKAVSKVPRSGISETAEIISEQGQLKRNELFLKSGYEHIRIMVDEIIYIKSDADYTELFTKENKHLSSEPLRYWLQQLNQVQFVRTHKSYIINTAKIEKVVGNQVYLVGKITIPIGRAYKERFMKNLL